MGKLRRLEGQILAHALVNLQFFNNALRLKKVLGEYIYKHLTFAAQSENFIKHLQTIDPEKTGKLSRSFLLESIRAVYGIDYSEDQVDKMIAEVDTLGTGAIEYEPLSKLISTY